MDTNCKAVFDLIRGWFQPGIPVGFCGFPSPAPPAVRLTCGSGKIMFDYNDGGALMRMPFTVTLRCKHNDSSDSFAALELLTSLCDDLIQALPDLSGGDVPVGIIVTSPPCLSNSYPGGTDEYSASLELLFDRELKEEAQQ